MHYIADKPQTRKPCKIGGSSDSNTLDERLRETGLSVEPALVPSTLRPDRARTSAGGAVSDPHATDFPLPLPSKDRLKEDRRVEVAGNGR